MTLNDKELEIRRKLKNDFYHYASKCLKIRTKSGKIEPFELNDAQRYIHSRIEDQREKTGKVRAIILKGRQQGCSTYAEGRFYWRVTHKKGVRAFILTHEESATINLFDLAKRYHDNCPTPVKPSTGASSAKELYFDLLDSGYKVGTAGNKSVGRSSTVQLFHGSEVAFWPNANEHAAGILQAIPDELDTEIILESTACGLGNFFHKIWQEAESGTSEYIAIFVPWYWQKEYRKNADGLILTEDEILYRDSYDLDNEQIAWMRNKISELGDRTLFKQEYPANASEAFQISGLDPLIKPDDVLIARKDTSAEAYGAKALGVDIARFGADRTTMTYRQGRVVHWFRAYSKKDTMEVVGLIHTAIKELEMKSIEGDRVFVDMGSFGAAVYDRLKEVVEDKNLIVGVDFGGSPLDARKYGNKRAEMWGLMNEWIKSPPSKVPDSDELQADLVQIRYKYDSNGALWMEKKEDMKKRGFRSPDVGDSFGLTFAFPLIPKKMSKPVKQRTYGSGSWMG